MEDAENVGEIFICQTRVMLAESSRIYHDLRSYEFISSTFYCSSNCASGAAEENSRGEKE